METRGDSLSPPARFGPLSFCQGGLALSFCHEAAGETRYLQNTSKRITKVVKRLHRRMMILGLVLLLLLGCASPPAEPPKLDPTLLTYTDEDLAEAATVTYVVLRETYSPASQAHPLWGDLESDRPKIAHLLHLLREAKPAPDPIGLFTDENLTDAAWLEIRFDDDRRVRLYHVEEQIRRNTYRIVPDRVFLQGTGEMIAPGLAAFLSDTAPNGRRAMMPHAPSLRVEPGRPKPGEVINIYGEGWVDAGWGVLSLIEPGGQKRRLGEVMIERGAYQWQGSLPPDLKPLGKMPYSFSLEVIAPRVAP